MNKIINKKQSRYLIAAVGLGFIAIFGSACNDDSGNNKNIGTAPVISETQDLDLDFGQDGFVINDLTDSDDELYDMALQSDGKIVVVGEWSGGAVIVQRYTFDGTLDNSFSENGTFIFEGRLVKAYAVEIQFDGKIVVVGHIREHDAGGDNLLLIRLNSDGTLDDTFGSNGIVTTHISEYGEYGYAVTVQNDGKIVIGGEIHIDGQDIQILIIRYNSDGTIDSSFGTDGVVTYDGIGWDKAKNIFMQLNDKIIVTGTTSAPYPNVTQTDYIILRYNSDGTLDNTFGTNGIVTFDNIGSESVLVQNDGRIVIGGGTWDPIPATLIIRLNSDGGIDNSFGQDGVVTYINNISSLPMGCAAIAVSDGEDIVIVGNNSRSTVVIRVTHDGTYDTSFSIDGISTIYPYPGDSTLAVIRSAVIQSDSSIVLAGYCEFHDTSSDNAILLAKLTGK